ncbi:hypothetical protein [Qipengyuania sp. JC766]|uniref:hypothetical protein n=1 Tax=Qipengyuania sp. JC766 TaxID=3232139 RepID=UPI00345782E7
MTSENKALIGYIAAAVNLAVGFFILVGLYPELADGEITAINYVVRGLGPLILAATLILLARQVRVKDDVNNA